LEEEMIPDEACFDYLRSEYFTNYIAELAKSRDEDGVSIVGAFAWSFIDNNEWGTSAQRYGMQTVDRKTQTRRFKRSIFDYVDAFQKAVKDHR
jgi:beta-glucosidase/6-phospho-beta-glucosidase/beta-galactosidase